MKLLVPLDGTPAALLALRWVARLASDGLQCSVVLANVQSPSTLYEVVVAHDADVLQQVSAEAGAHALEAGAAMLRAAGIEHELEVATGDAGHELADVAERYGCDMVVMVARSAGELSGALLGSVSHGVLRQSRVPVTIVRPEAVSTAPEAADVESLEDR